MSGDPVRRKNPDGDKAPAELFSTHELLDFGVLAERLGFGAAAVSDRLQSWRDTTGRAPNCFVSRRHAHRSASGQLTPGR